uniref:Uncharacterized protein n=1 Tax=uncultured bacterium contig00052 TaxID=1181536 RepID=A0A806KCB3_9BACT|nr:hypothetical protein [uncultured bacterium contig00052]
MKKDFSQLSFFLRMDIKRVRKQAMLAALPKLSLFWGMAAPLIFVLWLLADAFFGFQGLGMLIKNAYSKSDMPLLHGGIFCGFSFACILSACFLFLKSILPRK